MLCILGITLRFRDAVLHRADLCINAGRDISCENIITVPGPQCIGLLSNSLLAPKARRGGGAHHLPELLSESSPAESSSSSDLRGGELGH